MFPFDLSLQSFRTVILIISPTHELDGVLLITQDILGSVQYRSESPRPYKFSWSSHQKAAWINSERQLSKLHGRANLEGL